MPTRLAFAAQWQNRSPLVIVPTMYHMTPTAAYRAAGVSTEIWANPNLRAAMTAMQEACRRILQDEGLGGIEGKVASVNDVFELVDNRELTEAERCYLPSKK